MNVAQKYHQTLSHYFLSKSLYLDESSEMKPNTRKLAEQAWQQAAAGLWNELEATLCDLRFIEAKCKAGKERDLLLDFDSGNILAAQQEDNKRGEWDEWRQFVNLEAHNFEHYFNQYTNLVFQQALNQPKEGYVSKTAQKQFALPASMTSYWFERVNRPNRFYPSACLRIHLRKALHPHLLNNGNILSVTADYTLEIWNLDTGAVIHNLKGHKEEITAITICPGQKAVTASKDGSLRIWDLESGSCLYVLEERSENLLFTVAGPYIISGIHKAGGIHTGPGLNQASDFYSLWVWNSENGQREAVLDGHQGFISQLITLSANRIVSISNDQSLRIWDASTTQCITRIAASYIGNTRYQLLSDYYAVSYQEDIRVSNPGVFRDTSMRIWDLSTGVCCTVIEQENGKVHKIQPALKGELTCISFENKLRILDTKTGEQVQEIEGYKNKVEILTLLPGTQKAICTDGTHSLRIWDLVTGRSFGNLDGNELCAPITSVKNELFISSSRQHDLHVWDLDTGIRLRILRGHTAPVKNLCVAGDHHLISTSEDGTVRIWDLATVRLRRLPEAESPRGTLPRLLTGELALTVQNKNMHIWNLETGVCQHTLQGHHGNIEQVEVSPEGKIISMSADDTLRVWDMDTGQCLHTLSGHTNKITRLELLPANKVMTASEDGTLKVWDINSGQCLNSCGGHEGRINAIEMLPGNAAATGGSDGTLKIWDLNSGKCLHTLKGHANITRLLPLPDNRILSVGHKRTEDFTRYNLCAWSITAGNLIQVLAEDVDYILHIAQNNANLVAVACNNGDVRVWEVQHYTCMHTFQPNRADYPGYRHALHIEFDASNRIIAKCNDGKNRVWNLQTGEFIGFTATKEAQNESGKQPIESSTILCTESGLLWQQANGKNAFYPVNGKPGVVFTKDYARALLIEPRSNIIHILHLHNDIQPKLPGILNTFKMDPVFDDSAMASFEKKEKITNTAASVVVFIIVLLIGLTGLSIGFITPWLWLIGLPVFLFSLLVIIVGLRKTPNTLFIKNKYTSVIPVVLEAMKLRKHGKLNDAEKQLRSAAAILIKQKNEQGNLLILFELAGVLEEQGKATEALNCLEQAEVIIKKGNYNRFYKRCILGQYLVHRKTLTNFDRLIEILEELEKLVNGENNEEHALLCAAERIRMLYASGKKSEAFKATLETCNKYNDKNAEKLSSLLGVDIRDKATYNELVTETLYNKEVVELHNEVYKNIYPARFTEIINQQAVELAKLGDYKKALEMFRQVEEIAVQEKHDINRLSALGNQAKMLGAMGKTEESERLFEQAASIATRLGDEQRLMLVLTLHAEVLIQNRGDLQKALRLLKQAEEIACLLKDDKELLAILYFQLQIHTNGKDHYSKLNTLEKLIAKLYGQIGREKEIVKRLCDKAIVMEDMEADSASVILVYDEIEQLCNRIGEIYYLAVAKAHRGQFTSRKLGLHQEALADIKQAQTIMRRLGKEEDLGKINEISRIIEQQLTSLEHAVEKVPATAYSENLTAATTSLQKAIAWMHKHDKHWNECQSAVAASKVGTEPEKVKTIIMPFLNSEKEQVRRHYSNISGSFWMIRNLSTVANDEAVGILWCRVCEHPTFILSGSSIGIKNNCSACGREWDVNFIEYSVQVGLQIRELFEQHSLCLDLVERALNVKDKAQFDDALTWYRNAEAICREIGNKSMLAKVFGYMAEIYSKQNSFREAIDLYEQRQQLCIETGNKAALVETLKNRADIFFSQYDFEQTDVLLNQAEDICRAHEENDRMKLHFASILDLKALLLSFKAETIEEAMTTAKEAELCFTGYMKSIAEKTGRVNTTTEANTSIIQFIEKRRAKLNTGTRELTLRANEAFERGDKGATLIILKQLEAAFRVCEDLKGLKQCLNSQLQILLTTGEITGAFHICKELETICRKQEDQGGLAVALLNLAQFYKVLEKPLEAEAKQNEGEAIRLKLERVKKSIPGIKSKADTAFSKKQWNVAGDLYKKLVEDYAMLGQKWEQLQALQQVCNTQTSCGNYYTALFISDREEAIARELGIVAFVAQALIRQATILKVLEDWEGVLFRYCRAIKSFGQVIEACRMENANEDMKKLLPVGQKGMKDILNEVRTLGDTFVHSGNLLLAITAYRKAVELREPFLEDFPLDFSLRFNQIADIDELGITLMKGNRQQHEEGKQFVRKALNMLEKLDLDDPDNKQKRDPAYREILAHLGKN